MKITYYNHASMSIRSNNGFEILTDPWIYGPIYGPMLAQFMVLREDPPPCCSAWRDQLHPRAGPGPASTSPRGAAHIHPKGGTTGE